MREPVATRAFSALRWGYAGFATRTLASFASGIVLARLLGPKPFGQLAAATLACGLANQLADGGFSSALIQAYDLEKDDVRFAFTFQLTIGAVLTAACILLAPLLGAAFHDPQIGNVVRAISLVFLIQAFGQTSAALLKRKLAFRPLQTAQVFSFVAGYALVGIGAAVAGAGVWSLVAAQLAQALIYSLLLYVQVRHSVVPCWTRPSLRLARFGIKVTGVNVLNWSISNFDNAFVARAFGSTALGLYSRAFNTVSTPADAVVSTWQQVLFASCSRAGERARSLQRAYLASVSAVSLITFPVFWSVAACAAVVIKGLYGSQWIGAAPLLTPLAVAITFHAVMALAGPMLSAADQVRREVERQTVSLLFAVAAFALTIRYSAIALAWAVLGVYVFRLVAMTGPALRLLQLRWADLLRVMRGPAILGLATASAVWTVGYAASLQGVRPGWTLALLGLGGLTTISIFLLSAPDRVLSRELVLVVTLISASLPVPLSRWLEKIDAKQASSETAGQVKLYEVSSVEAMTP